MATLLDGYTPIADHGLIGDLQTSGAGHHRRCRRLVLLPAVRLAEHLRVAARPTTGRALQDRAGDPRVRQPGSSTSPAPRS